jgi:hypothetical protein
MHFSYNLCVTFSRPSSQWKIDKCNMMTFNTTFLSYCIYYPKTTYCGGSSHALEASPMALIAKIFFTSKFSYVLFCNPTIMLSQNLYMLDFLHPILLSGITYWTWLEILQERFKFCLDTRSNEALLPLDVAYLERLSDHSWAILPLG